MYCASFLVLFLEFDLSCSLLVLFLSSVSRLCLFLYLCFFGSAPLFSFLFYFLCSLRRPLCVWPSLFVSLSLFISVSLYTLTHSLSLSPTSFNRTEERDKLVNQEGWAVRILEVSRFLRAFAQRDCCLALTQADEQPASE